MTAEKSLPDDPSELKVKELGQNDIPQWENYIAESPKATFYHRLEWKNIIEKSFGHKTYYLMAVRCTDNKSCSDSQTSTNQINSAMRHAPCAMQESEKVVGILPMVHIRSLLFGSIFCSMPFLNFGGVCADDDEGERVLLQAAENIVKERKGDYLELRHLTQSAMNIPVKNHKISMTVDLDPDPEVLWSHFSTKHRTNIRKTVKNGLEIKWGRKELLTDFYSLMCSGWKDLGTPIYGYSFFENILKELENSVEIYLVIFQGKPIATAFNGMFKDTVEGMWLSTLPEFEKLSPSYFLYWEMIKRACQGGYKQFHLGRSSVESGGEFFKKKWNAVPKQLYWEYILNGNGKIPELNTDNPKYQFAIKVWKKLPLPITKKAGADAGQEHSLNKRPLLRAVSALAYALYAMPFEVGLGGREQGVEKERCRSLFLPLRLAP